METLSKTIKYGLLILAFLLPVFFLPYTIFPTALNKQFFLAVFCFLIFILWLVRTIVSGRINLGLNLQSFSVLVLVLVLGISTAFSISKTQSFWGMANEPDAFFNFILYGLTFFLFANLLESKKEIFRVIGGFLAGAGLLAVFFLLRAFGLAIFPWSFTQTIAFNPVGTIQALGIFLGGAFVVLVAILGSQLISRKLIKILLIFLGLILFATILFINFQTIWILLLLGQTTIILGMGKYLLSETGLAKTQVTIKGKRSSKIQIRAIAQTKEIEPAFPLKNFILPLAIIALSLVLIFIKQPFFNVIKIPIIEISPTYRATLDIAKKTIEETPKNLILGSGLGTFVYKYRLYRTAGYSLIFGPNLVFGQGRAALPTLLTTSGILGVLAVLIMFGIFLYSGLKIFLAKKYTQEAKGMNRIQLAVFAGGLYFLLAWFFYPINFTLAFAGFLMVGLWLSSLEPENPFRSFKKISFVASPQKAFFALLGAVILISGSIIFLFTISQKYIGALNYVAGLNLSNAPSPDLNEATTKIQKAILLDRSKDIYYRALSQVFILKAAQSQVRAEEQDLTTTIDAAQRTAQMATRVNSQDSVNWLQLGSVYENIIPFAQGADQFAISNYKKAKELDPQNSQISYNIGRVYLSRARQIGQALAILRQAETSDQQKEQELINLKRQNLENSVGSLREAIILSPRFSAAYYLLGQVYEELGDKQLALQSYSSALVLDPQNATIRAKVDELSR